MEDVNRKTLMEMFNKQPRLGTLSTSDGDGNVNAAIFNSLRMVDEDTVVMALGENRSLSYLQKNPKAAFVFFEPAQSPYDWKGARVYLDVEKIEAAGPLFDKLVSAVRSEAGDRAADGILVAVTFKISEVRPLIEMTASA